MAGGRKEFSGGAQDLTLATALSATGLTIVVSGDLTTWPTGVHPFVIDIDETEKVLVTSRSGSVMTVASTSDRGYDNTTGVSHLVGAVVRHVLDAGTVEEANAHVNDDTRDDHSQYLNTTRHDVTARHALGVSIATGTPGSSAVGDAAAAGVSGSAARADHRHAREGFGTPGSSAVGDTATAGTATTVARSDHKHGREGFGSPVASAIGDAAADGTATTLARSDHKHAREAAGTPGTSSPGDTASAGSATTVARSDHRHAREAAPGITQNSTGNAADQGMAAGDEITMASQAISPTATRLIQVSGAFQVRAVTVGSSFAGYLRLKLDGTNMTGGEIRFNNHSLTDLVNVSWVAWAQVAAGSHTITLVGTNDITSGTTVYCDARILNVNQIGG